MVAADDRGEEVVVDVQGEFCPVPIIEMAKAMKKISVGGTVLLRCTDPGAESDIPAWCKATGNEILSMVRQGGLIEARIRRTR